MTWKPTPDGVDHVQSLAILPRQKTNSNWAGQVKLGRGRTNTGAFHREIAVATHLFAKGRWNGRGLLVVHDAYETYNKQYFYHKVLVTTSTSSM